MLFLLSLKRVLNYLIIFVGFKNQELSGLYMYTQISFF